MSNHGYYMRRALQVAARPIRTAPNPRVGAVVVRDGRILSEAAHEGVGKPHAERKALDGIDADGATLYVTLEPCAHEGRTPPCAPFVASSGVSRVVAAIEDPDDRVAGRGFDILRQAGVEVVTGVLADEAEALNRAFLHHRRTGRPFITLKLALSIDGRLGPRNRDSRWITGPEARAYVHGRRAEVDAVMIGAGSVVADDPSLTVRDAPVVQQPLRIVVDPHGRTPMNASMLRDGGEVLVATTGDASHDLQVGWKEVGAEVVQMSSKDGQPDLEGLLDDLGRRGVTEIYCEGGATLATVLLQQGLVDRLEIHHGPVLLGRGGPEIGDLGVDEMADAERWATRDVVKLGDDVVIVWERS